MKVARGVLERPAESPPASSAGSLPAVEIVDPFTGEICDRNDVDELCRLYRFIGQREAEIRDCKDLIRRRLAEMTTGEAKTRRVIGRDLIAVVEMPSANWNNAKLKEAWNSYPDHAPKYLRIGSIEPKLVEVKKLRESSGDPAFETFKGMVLGAESAPTALPAVKVEEVRN